MELKQIVGGTVMVSQNLGPGPSHGKSSGSMRKSRQAGSTRSWVQRVRQALAQGIPSLLGRSKAPADETGKKIGES